MRPVILVIIHVQRYAPGVRWGGGHLYTQYTHKGNRTSTGTNIENANFSDIVHGRFTGLEATSYA